MVDTQGKMNNSSMFPKSPVQMASEAKNNRMKGVCDKEGRDY